MDFQVDKVDEAWAEEYAVVLGDLCRENHWHVVTAESCTGGLVAGAMTAVPGASEWFDRGFVTYTNDAKHEMLGVSTETLQTYGAVSEETAREMAQGAAKAAKADLAVSVTGIAGPGGGTEKTPVGTVCFGFMVHRGKKYQGISTTAHFAGDREAVRRQSVALAIVGLVSLIRKEQGLVPDLKN